MFTKRDLDYMDMLILKGFGLWNPPWHLDTYSTILSRTTSFHKRKGKLLYAKTKKISYPTRSLSSFLRSLYRLRSCLPMCFRFLLPLSPRPLLSTTESIRRAAKKGILEYKN